MKRFLFFLLCFLSLCSSAQYTNRELILNTTGNGFNTSTSNGIDSEKWDYIQKFANLTYNGQDASISAVRFYVDWSQYEPTPGDYQGRAKIVQAIQAITNLKSGTMKIALHFPYQRPGPQPGQSTDGYFDNSDIAKTSDGSYVRQTITFSNPSIYSSTGKQRFYAFVSDVMSQLAASNLLGKILYCQMGNGSAEEFAMPYLNENGQLQQGMYDDNALSVWRTQYLPCRYPNQTNVSWDGNNYAIASAPPATSAYGDWNNEQQREYHRFASWGLMNFYKGFRDVIKSYSSSLKVLYYISDFGGGQGNVYFMHSASIPMGLNEFDGIYTTDGTYTGDLWKKIKSIDAIKGTNANKIAGMEFDQEDLGQTGSSGTIVSSIASEWMARAYKHGVNYVHLAMFFNDTEIDQLKPVLAGIRSTYLSSSYTAPARQSPITQNLFPTVFTGTDLFSSWGTANGDNWSATDNNPVSINMTDDGYWQNIWSCTPSNPCDYNISGSASNSNPSPSASISLSYICSGSACSGVSYAWSGNGVSGNSSPLNITAPSTPGNYTYTITASKSGCTDKTNTVQIAVQGGGGGGGSYNQCLESENSSGDGAISSDPNASNGETRGEESNYNHYVDYALTGVPSAGTYAVTLRYYSSSAPTVGVQVNGGSTQTVNLASSGSWNIVWTTQQFSVTLAAGSNTIRISGTGGVSCRQDQICVTGSGTCTPPVAPSLSASPSSITSGSSSTLSASGCSGGTVSWSDGLGTGTSKTVSPTSTTTYTATCSIGGCTSNAASVTITVEQGGGGSYDQCLESENSSGNGAITSDPNASNGETRGEESNYNHYVDYAITGVPSAGTYTVTLRYYSSSAPTVNVEVNGGSTQTVNLANSGSWNIVWTTQQFNITLAAGSNTIRVSGTGGGSCRQDQLCVTGSGNSSMSRITSKGLSLKATPEDLSEIDRNIPLTVFPNPNKGVFEADFYLGNGKKATLLVSDVAGRTVYTRLVTGQGLHREKIYLNNKASGVLFLRLIRDNAIEVSEINIIK
ncbi:MAG: carbohydrate-binding protein [Ginsengibacter sp.]